MRLTKRQSKELLKLSDYMFVTRLTEGQMELREIGLVKCPTIDMFGLDGNKTNASLYRIILTDEGYKVRENIKHFESL